MNHCPKPKIWDIEQALKVIARHRRSGILESPVRCEEHGCWHLGRRKSVMKSLMKHQDHIGPIPPTLRAKDSDSGLVQVES